MGLNDAQTGLQVPLEAVISTQELSLRPPRPPNSDALNRALITLAQTLARSPQHILKELVEAALDLCGAHSAGISLLEEENGRKIFRWHALAGQYAPISMARHLANSVRVEPYWIRTRFN